MEMELLLISILTIDHNPKIRLEKLFGKELKARMKTRYELL